MRREPLMSRDGQASVVVAVLCCVALGAVSYRSADRPARLIDIDQAAAREFAFTVDVNTAAETELSMLPGIGTRLAERIVESRDVDGPFLDVEDLLRVKGIGPKKLSAMRSSLAPIPPQE